MSLIMPVTQTAHYAKVLLAIKKKILNDILPGGYVYISGPEAAYIDDNYEHRYAVPPSIYAERFISIACGPVSYKDDKSGTYNQQGRYFRNMKRVLSIGYSTRLSLDKVGEDEIRLTDDDPSPTSVMGHMWLEEMIIKSLDLINPPVEYEDIANWANPAKSRLLTEPMKLLHNNSTYRSNQKSKPSVDMLVSFLNFETCYAFPFTNLGL